MKNYSLGQEENIGSITDNKFPKIIRHINDQHLIVGLTCCCKQNGKVVVKYERDALKDGMFYTYTDKCLTSLLLWPWGFLTATNKKETPRL